jgi:hypothetical protein
LATGKGGDPLAAGKPFINNFLPNGGDMLRLNMAVPVTQRTDPAFSSEGIIAAAVAGLTDPAYNTDASLQFIPNMDGFPNGRRLEDDVTRIELQAVGGVALAAIGLWYRRLQRQQPCAKSGDQPPAEQPAVQHRCGGQRRHLQDHVPLRGRSLEGYQHLNNDHDHENTQPSQEPGRLCVAIRHNRHRQQSPRSTVDQQRPARGQHRRLRIPVPGRPQLR